MKRLAGVCILMIVCMFAPVPAYSAVSINDNVDRYDINGRTAAELRREMSAKGPAGSGGRRFDGYTKWYVSWSYRYRNVGAGCVIASVSTSVRVTITLPQWRNESAGDSATRAQWARYIAALELHERGHRQNGVDAANEVDQAIAAMPPAGSCDALGSAANALGMSILQRYNQRDIDYDNETRHGATQGARFP